MLDQVRPPWREQPTECRVLPVAGLLPLGGLPMEAEELFIDEIAAIIARLTMQAEQLSLHIAGLKQHSDNDEVASEEARLQKMQRHLHRLQKLKALYDTSRVTDPIYLRLP